MILYIERSTAVWKAVSATRQVVEARKAELKVVVDAHRSERLRFKEKLQQEAATRDLETKAFVEDVLVQTKSRRLGDKRT